MRLLLRSNEKMTSSGVIGDAVMEARFRIEAEGHRRIVGRIGHPLGDQAVLGRRLVGAGGQQRVVDHAEAAAGSPLHRERVEAVERALGKAARCAALGGVGIDPIEVREAGGIFRLADQRQGVVALVGCRARRSASDRRESGLQPASAARWRRGSGPAPRPADAAEQQSSSGEKSGGDVETRKHQAFPLCVTDRRGGQRGLGRRDRMASRAPSETYKTCNAASVAKSAPRGELTCCHFGRRAAPPAPISGCSGRPAGRRDRRGR